MSALLAIGCMSPRKSEQSLRKAFVRADATGAALGDIEDDAGALGDVATDDDAETPPDEADDAAVNDTDAGDIELSLDVPADVPETSTVDPGKDGGAGVDGADAIPDGADTLAGGDSDASPDAAADATSPDGFSARGAFSSTASTPTTSAIAVRATGFLSAKTCGGGYCAIGGWTP